MDERIRAIAERLKRHLLVNYGALIKGVILYGSFARGAADDDSDLDFLIITDDRLERWEVWRSLDPVFWEVLLETGLVISVLVVTESYYEGYHSPFLINVRREWVVI